MNSTNKNLSHITALKQSIWYDNLSRDVLNSGELKAIIESGVRGLTSNPSIFKKAIADSTDYDADIKKLSPEFSDIESLTEKLMMEDVKKAAELLLPLYESSRGIDGLASIELSPYLAHETEKSIEQGKRIWKTLGAKNIMIKVPATDAGLPVIEALLAEGINVNVTLIFSASVYERVIESFMSGLERRVASGGDITSIQSVASFFVSRVDSIIEQSCKKLSMHLSGDEIKSLEGTVGIANSKAAYQSFKKLFSSKRWKALEAKGAHVQRPLWASTGTKNPAFDPLLYVKYLVGPNTVNTVPPQTLKEIIKQDHSYSNLLEEKPEASKALLDKLLSLGIPWEALLVDLQVQGVKLFADAYTELLAAVKNKKETLS